VTHTPSQADAPRRAHAAMRIGPAKATRNICWPSVTNYYQRPPGGPNRGGGGRALQYLSSGILERPQVYLDFFPGRVIPDRLSVWPLNPQRLTQQDQCRKKTAQVPSPPHKTSKRLLKSKILRTNNCGRGPKKSNKNYPGNLQQSFFTSSVNGKPDEMRDSESRPAWPTGS